MFTATEDTASREMIASSVFTAHPTCVADVVVGALNDFVTFCVYWCHFEWNLKTIHKYFKKLEPDQLEKNKEHMSDYLKQMFLEGDDILTPLCVKRFLDKGYATMANNLYERFKPKDPNKITNRIKEERDKAINRLESDNNKDIMYSCIQKNDFYIQSEHRAMYSELNVIYEIINDNYKVALKLIKDKKHATYLKRVKNMMEKFITKELPEYLEEISDFYRSDIKISKPKKKKKKKAKQDYFILGEKVSKRKFEKELKFYQNDEDYIVNKNNIMEVC